MIDAIYNGGLTLIAAGWWSTLVWPVIWNLIKILCIVLPLMGAVAYLTLWERKLLGFMQVRYFSSAWLAASTMPSDRPNFILRGARLATITVSLPTSCSGWYMLLMPLNTLRVLG